MRSMHRKGLPCGRVSAVRHTGGERELSQSPGGSLPGRGRRGRGSGRLALPTPGAHSMLGSVLVPGPHRFSLV